MEFSTNWFLSNGFIILAEFVVSLFEYSKSAKKYTYIFKTDIFLGQGSPTTLLRDKLHWITQPALILVWKKKTRRA